MYRTVGKDNFQSSHSNLLNNCTHVSEKMKNLDEVLIIRHHPGRCELFGQALQHNKCANPDHLAWGCASCNSRDTLARKHVETFIHNLLVLQPKHVENMTIRSVKSLIDYTLNEFYSSYKNTSNNINTDGKEEQSQKEKKQKEQDIK
jgi:hypothetical protein